MSSSKISEMWVVPGDPETRLFHSRDAALARAWELTPAGGHRAEPVEKPVFLVTNEPPPRLEGNPTRFITATAPPKPAVGDIWVPLGERDVRTWDGKAWAKRGPAPRVEGKRNGKVFTTAMLARVDDRKAVEIVDDYMPELLRTLRREAASTGDVIDESSLSLTIKGDDSLIIVHASCGKVEPSVTDEMAYREMSKRTKELKRMSEKPLLTTEELTVLLGVLDEPAPDRITRL
jgi:hypothetical protein